MTYYPFPRKIATDYILKAHEDAKQYNQEPLDFSPLTIRVWANVVDEVRKAVRDGLLK